MTRPVVRKISWDFDATVPFMWQPKNPNFGLFCNAFTFIAVPFERYIVAAVRAAANRFDDNPDVAAEADAFLRQEAQHAAAHRKHMLALIERYPGLEQCYVNACRSYDQLIDERPIEFHAAYIANLEATFTPLFKVMLDHRDAMFGGGDRRVASLMMWHFVEEIEHRSSGLLLCRHVNPSPWYRVRHLRETSRHIAALAQSVADTFDEVVPFEDRGASTRKLMSKDLMTRELKYRMPWRQGRRRDGAPSIFQDVPSSQLVKMVWRLWLSQTPYHDPAAQPLPDWADTWMREYERGTDMTTFFGAPAEG
jgi:predicted metal-dependent hydrolase